MEPASHSEAKRLGSRTYFTGRPCKHGHTARRYTTNGTCTVCSTAQVRDRYHVNSVAIRARRKAHRSANPEIYRSAERRRYWADHATATAANQRKRAARLGLESTLTGQDIRDVIDAQNGRCASCGDLAQLTVDHIKPLSKQGPNTRANIQMLCLPCNSAKGDK